MQFTDLQVVNLKIEEKIIFFSDIRSKNSDSPWGKLIINSIFNIIFGKNLFFNPISSVGPREILISTLGAEIFKFETCSGPNFDVERAVNRQPGYRPEDA